MIKLKILKSSEFMSLLGIKFMKRNTKDHSLSKLQSATIRMAMSVKVWAGIPGVNRVKSLIILEVVSPWNSNTSFLCSELSGPVGGIHSGSYPILDLTLLQDHQPTFTTRWYKNVILIFAGLFAAVFECSAAVPIFLIIIPLALQTIVIQFTVNFSSGDKFSRKWSNLFF